MGMYKFICNGPLVRQIAPDGTITDLDFSVDGSRAAAVAGTTSDLTVSTDSGSIFQISVVTGTRTLFASGFTQPTGMDFRPAGVNPDDHVGFLYVADTASGTISQISVSGRCDAVRDRAGMPNYMAFQTISSTPLPVVVTGVASVITDTTATLNGTVNPSGSDTTYHFEYGFTTSYGSTTTITSAGSGFTAVPVSAALTGLSPRNVVSLPRNGDE